MENPRKVSVKLFLVLLTIYATVTESVVLASGEHMATNLAAARNSAEIKKLANDADAEARKCESTEHSTTEEKNNTLKAYNAYASALTTARININEEIAWAECQAFIDKTTNGEANVMYESAVDAKSAADAKIATAKALERSDVGDDIILAANRYSSLSAAYIDAAELYAISNERYCKADELYIEAQLSYEKEEARLATSSAQ
jgi:hypothetical protein